MIGWVVFVVMSLACLVSGPLPLQVIVGAVWLELVGIAGIEWCWRNSSNEGGPNVEVEDQPPAP